MIVTSDIRFTLSTLYLRLRSLCCTGRIMFCLVCPVFCPSSVPSRDEYISFAVQEYLTDVD